MLSTVDSRPPSELTPQTLHVDFTINSEDAFLFFSFVSFYLFGLLFFGSVWSIKPASASF